MSEAADRVHTITALRPKGRNAEIAELDLDGAPLGPVSYAVLSEARLGVGDTLTGAELVALQAADERWRAKQSALALLAVRARARAELAQRLRRKGYGEAAVEYAVAESERLALLDDAAFAAAWVRDRLKLRPRGARALVHELGRKGVPGDVARMVVEREMASAAVSDEQLCIAAAERWARTRGDSAATGGTDRGRIARRLGAFLARRGYAPGHIRAAVDAALARAGGA